MESPTNPLILVLNEVKMKQNSKKRIRSVNFTRKECELIVDLVIKYKHIVENRRSDAATWKAKEAAWEKIKEEYNKILGNEIRTTQSIRSKYESLKKNARKERFSGGDIRTSLSSSMKEKIRLLQDTHFDALVNEESVQEVKSKGRQGKLKISFSVACILIYFLFQMTMTLLSYLWRWI